MTARAIASPIPVPLEDVALLLLDDTHYKGSTLTGSELPIAYGAQFTLGSLFWVLTGIG